jgi:hypothetical protein
MRAYTWAQVGHTTEGGPLRETRNYCREFIYAGGWPCCQQRRQDRRCREREPSASSLSWPASGRQRGTRLRSPACCCRPWVAL